MPQRHKWYKTCVAIAVGQMIVNELEKVGFSAKWEGLADKRVAVLDMVWDKQYQDSSIF